MPAWSRNPCRTSAESMHVTRVSVWYVHKSPCRLSRNWSSKAAPDGGVSRSVGVYSPKQEPERDQVTVRERSRRWRGLTDQGQGGAGRPVCQRGERLPTAPSRPG